MKQGFKNYRGITWKNDCDLSSKLGKSGNYVHAYKKTHPEATNKDIIDTLLERGDI